MKKKIKKWVLSWLMDKESEYSPKKSRDLKAVSFRIRDPIDGKHSNQWLFHCTQWDNGEGFLFDINCYNELSKQNQEMHYSLCLDELDGIFACLNDLKYFEEE